MEKIELLKKYSALCSAEYVLTKAKYFGLNVRAEVEDSSYALKYFKSEKTYTKSSKIWYEYEGEYWFAYPLKSGRGIISYHDKEEEYNWDLQDVPFVDTDGLTGHYFNNPDDDDFRLEINGKIIIGGETPDNSWPWTKINVLLARTGCWARLPKPGKQIEPPHHMRRFYKTETEKEAAFLKKLKKAAEIFNKKGLVVSSYKKEQQNPHYDPYGSGAGSGFYQPLITCVVNGIQLIIDAADGYECYTVSYGELYCRVDGRYEESNFESSDPKVAAFLLALMEKFKHYIFPACCNWNE